MERRRLAEIKKKAEENKQTIIFLDEAGFYLLPSVYRTYAPIGETPILKEKYSRDHLSAISVVTPDGQVYLKLQEKSFKGIDIISFLEELLIYIKGKLLIFWDRSPIHRAGAVKDFVNKQADGRIEVEYLPPYAPMLNPDEGIWNNLKKQLKNVCCYCLNELKEEIIKAKDTLVKRKKTIFNFFRHAGLY